MSVAGRSGDAEGRCRRIRTNRFPRKAGGGKAFGGHRPLSQGRDHDHRHPPLRIDRRRGMRARRPRRVRFAQPMASGGQRLPRRTPHLHDGRVRAPPHAIASGSASRDGNANLGPFELAVGGDRTLLRVDGQLGPSSHGRDVAAPWPAYRPPRARERIPMASGTLRSMSNMLPEMRGKRDRFPGDAGLLRSGE